tara:strand:+ start:673 stop:930 length:258 start_codon:yes stop_codon:yes gene_type:complete
MSEKDKAYEKYEIVIVEWEDITSNTEPWLYISDALELEPAQMTTVGWLVEDREESIILISSIGDNKEVGDINCIPKSVIKDMREL